MYLGRAFSRDGRLLDEVLAVLMRAPNSYTREDVAEIHCHGGLMIPSLVLEACVAAGARLARPGEFTLRAFLSGRMDLAQAESVLALIQAGSATAARLAAEGLQGAPSRRVAQVRKDLLDGLSALEAGLDFGDEVQGLDEAGLLDRVNRVRGALQSWILQADQGRMGAEGLLTVVVGPPNAGKSTLWNQLLGEERALVSPYAGTTRDRLEAPVQLGGLRLRLVDTAGLRSTADPLEALGMGLTRKALEHAEVLVVILDCSVDWPGALEELPAVAAEIPCVVVLNKSDLPSRLRAGEARGHFPTARVVSTCLLDASGVEVVRVALEEACRRAGVGRTAGALSLNSRQYQALVRGLEHLDALTLGLASGVPLDCLAVDLRQAISALGEVSGEDVTEELLDRVFSQFCIGK